MLLFRLTEVSPLIPVYKMSVNFKKIYGNELIKALFVENIESNKIPHAIILEGDKGSGRYTFALNIAAASLCTDFDKPCGLCKNCRQIFDGVAPDVSTIALPEDKATISVEAVRLIKSGVQSVPVEGDLKFYIIRDADKMTAQAQNALLKILEEPPSFVVFILISENVNLLLSTIRSRCCMFRMQRFEYSELIEYISFAYPKADNLRKSDEDAFNRIVKAANGSIGNVLSNLEKRSLTKICDDYAVITGMLTALFKTNKSDFLRYEDELSSKREELRDCLFDMRSAFRDMLTVKKSITTQLCFFDSINDVKGITKSFTLSSVVHALDAIEQTLNSNEQNANVNLLKINLMNTLWKCVH